MDLFSLSHFFDHTMLKHDASLDELQHMCGDAKKWQCAAVCVYPQHVSFVSSQLHGTPVRPITVVGFPTGLCPTQVKVEQAKRAVEDGAQEIDMVVQREALSEKEYESVYRDIEAVVLAVKPLLVKVILETAELTWEQQVAGCALSQIAGAHFVKTSTGFSQKGGATAECVRFLKSVLSGVVEVKASGGIRTLSETMAMIQAGATRIGTSATGYILKQQEEAVMVDKGR